MRSVLVGDAKDSASGVTSDMESSAILVNLACDREAALIIGEPRGIRLICLRAFNTHNPLLMKILRNLSQWEELRIHFVVRNLLKLAHISLEIISRLVTQLLLGVLTGSCLSHIVSEDESNSKWRFNFG